MTNKFRIFKWKMLQEYKMSLVYIKERLIESTEVLLFLNVFHPIQTCVFNWGFNGFQQLGEFESTSIHRIYSNSKMNYIYKGTKISSHSLAYGQSNQNNFDTLMNMSEEDVKIIDKEENENHVKSISDLTENDTIIKVKEPRSYDRAKTMNFQNQFRYLENKYPSPSSKNPHGTFGIPQNNPSYSETYSIKRVNRPSPIGHEEAFANFYIKGDSHFIIYPPVDYFENQSPENVQQIERPRVNYQLLDKKLVSYTGRRYTNFYLCIDGEVFSSQKDNEIEETETKTESCVLKQFPTTDQKFITIKSGLRHGIALSSSNKVYTWGCNRLGQLGYDFQDLRDKIKIDNDQNT